MHGSIYRRIGAYAACVGLAVALAGCSGGDDDPPASSESQDASPTAPSSASGSADPGGTVTNILDWQPATATISNDDSGFDEGKSQSVMLVTPEAGKILQIPKNKRVADLLIDDSFAVVVMQDPKEEEPSVATVFDLGSDTTFSVGPDSDVPTTNGGTWALGEGTLFHATWQPKDSYCLAEVDLANQESAVSWCAPFGTGFNDARITPAGLTVLSFTLGKDGCRSPVAIAEGTATPIRGVTECIGWDSLVTPQGVIWSETPDANRIEEATFFATPSGGEKLELGTGDTGSLTWCGTSAYFTQQPQRDGDPARMYRWTPDGTLEIVYETPGSPGFISEPRCGGSRITISAKSEGGDHQVSAPS